MLPAGDRVRLQHMLDAARKALRLSAGYDREKLAAEDDPLADALVHLISVIGEAASRVSSGTCAELDLIPWPDVVGMRNRLIHAYFDINLDILWATVQDKPTLPRSSLGGVPGLGLNTFSSRSTASAGSFGAST